MENQLALSTYVPINNPYLMQEDLSQPVLIIGNTINYVLAQSTLPLLFILGGLLAGLLFERVILPKLVTFANNIHWENGQVIFRNLQYKTIWLLALSGIYGAVFSLPFPPAILIILQNILFFGLILLLTIIVAQIGSDLVRTHTQALAGMLPPTSLLANLTKLILVIIGILFIMQTLGISITPILTALGVGGLAVALALQDTLSNIFAGVYILASKQISPGDYIRLDTGEEGCVVDVDWRSTIIEQMPNNIVIVPNAKLGKAIVTNYQLPDTEVGIKVQVGISYDSDLEHVEAVTRSVAEEVQREVEGGVLEYQPLIRFHTFSDSSILMNVILRAKDFVSQYLLIHEFIKRLHRRYRQENIIIPFPIRTIYTKN